MLFTFPSRYLFTIGHQGVFRLGKWSPHIQTKFHVSRPTQEQKQFLPIQDYHLLWSSFPESSSYYIFVTGLIRIRSSLLTEYISFPPATKIFQFTRLALNLLCIHKLVTLKSRVSPFGYLRIKVCWQLPSAYRSLPRPSSSLDAKASTKCPFALDCNYVQRKILYVF